MAGGIVVSGRYVPQTKYSTFAINTVIMKCTAQLAIFGLSILFSVQVTGQSLPDESFVKDTTAPKPEIGFKLGANFQSITTSDWVQAYNAGFLGGFFVGLHKNKIGVRAEILASTAHYQSAIAIDSVGNKGNFNLIYLNVPLLLEYRVIPNLSILLGPQYNNVVSVTKLSTLDGDPKVLFKSGEFAAVLGVEGKLPHRIGIGARYIYGLTSVNNYAPFSNESWQTRSIQIYASYTIK